MLTNFKKISSNTDLKRKKHWNLKYRNTKLLFVGLSPEIEGSLLETYPIRQQTHPPFAEQLTSVQSGRHVSMKCGRGTAVSTWDIAHTAYSAVEYMTRLSESGISPKQLTVNTTRHCCQPRGHHPGNLHKTLGTAVSTWDTTQAAYSQTHCTVVNTWDITYATYVKHTARL